MTISTGQWVSAMILMGCVVAHAAEDAVQRARAELDSLAAKVKSFTVVRLPATGEVALSAEQSLTIESLRGVKLDDDPPVVGQPAKPYDPRMTDDFPPGKAPYMARDIQPFRFRYFNNEFNYGGWHNWGMHDYAVAHGFNILYPYNHSPADWTHAPKGTQWLKWGGFVDWPKWLKERNIPEGRYDRLPEMDVAQTLLDAGVFKPDEGFQFLMIDLEHPLLGPDKLRQQDWYPKSASEAERQAFERKYYEGYARTYIAPVQAARRAGRKNISLYGWQPFARAWFGVEKAQPDPATDFAWNAYGKRIYEAVDILNPSVYCFYWSPQNVAYTLANIDLNLRLVNSMPQRKPMRPYYWTLLHGGGAGWRWWSGQPLPNEEARAMTAFCFFTGCDGLVQWNWSGTGTHHAPPPLKEGVDAMVRTRFECRPEGSVEATTFERFDVLHVRSVAEGLVKFQRIDRKFPQASIEADKPTYAMPADRLLPLLRASSEPVSGVVEGLALVKPFEYLLWHGEVKVDVSAQEQFAQTLPIVRRVKLGRFHLLATYDPLCVHGGEPRQIKLPALDGQKGLMLNLPADAQTRLFVLEGG
jgi:hypothetical protein